MQRRSLTEINRTYYTTPSVTEEMEPAAKKSIVVPAEDLRLDTIADHQQHQQLFLRESENMDLPYDTDPGTLSHSQFDK